MISVAEANGISTVAQSKSLTAMAMVYRLKVDRKFGFLYVAMQTRPFPTMLVMLNAIQTLASVMTTAIKKSTQALANRMIFQTAGKPSTSRRLFHLSSNPSSLSPAEMALFDAFHALSLRQRSNLRNAPLNSPFVKV